jgi:hypothetical protein
VTFLEQVGLFPEGHDKRGSPAHPAQRITSSGAELPEFSRAQVGQFVLFEVAPDMFDRVQFRCIAGQPLQSEAVALSGDKVTDQSAAMARKTIPDHQQGSAQVAHQVLEKLDDLGPLDGPRKQFEIEVPPRDSGDHRKGFPIEVILQHRGLAAGSPGAHPVRAFA